MLPQSSWANGQADCLHVRPRIAADHRPESPGGRKLKQSDERGSLITPTAFRCSRRHDRHLRATQSMPSLYKCVSYDTCNNEQPYRFAMSTRQRDEMPAVPRRTSYTNRTPAQNTRSRRRRTSSLGGDPRGDTGAQALATTNLDRHDRPTVRASCLSDDDQAHAITC